MVRAGAVEHPSEWVGGSHAELLGEEPRGGGIIDADALLRCLGCGSQEAFCDWYARTLGEECERGRRCREPHWTEAAAVGDREWVERLSERVPSSWRRVEPLALNEGPGAGVSEQAGTYTLRMSSRRREGLLATLGGRRLGIL